MQHPKHTLLACLLALPHLAWAHAVMVKSEPARDAELAAAPPAIVLSFNETVEPAFSTIKLLDQMGKPVAIGKTEVDPGDGKRLRAAVPRLSQGKYTVQYRTVGRDGHQRSGNYHFQVK